MSALYLRKGRNQSVHVAQVEKDNEGNQDADSWTPNGRGQNEENHQNAPPWGDIEISQLLGILLFEQCTVLNNDNRCE